MEFWSYSLVLFYLYVGLFVYFCMFCFSLSLDVCQCAKSVNLIYLLHLFRMTTTNVTTKISEPFKLWSSLKGTASLMISMFYQKELYKS